MTDLGALDITVGILTFRRPQALSICLAEALQQATALSRNNPGVNVNVLVVDNDPHGSAETTAASFLSPVLRYVIERQPGIAAARNRVLDETHESDLLVFIDDDEVPQAEWLVGLVTTWRRTQAVAVMGRVVSIFDGDAPRHIVESGVFDRPRMPTGTAISVAAAGNLLIDLHAIRKLKVRFNQNLGLAGGEDTLFSRTVARRGGLMVWCDESVTHDRVDASRLTRRWLLRRAFSQGNQTVNTELQFSAGLLSSASIRSRWFVSGLTRLLAGMAAWTLSPVQAKAIGRTEAERLIGRGGGMVARALGIVYREYRR